MAQQIKTLAANPDDLSSIPGTHIVEEESQPSQAVLWPPQYKLKAFKSVNAAPQVGSALWGILGQVPYIFAAGPLLRDIPGDQILVYSGM